MSRSIDCGQLEYLPPQLVTLLAAALQGIESNENYAWMNADARALKAWNDTMAMVAVINEKIETGQAAVQPQGGK